jgi:hypothetical protein
MSSSEVRRRQRQRQHLAPARSANGSRRSKPLAVPRERCTGRKWMLVAMSSSASARWYSSRVAPARSASIATT